MVSALHAPIFLQGCRPNYDLTCVRAMAVEDAPLNAVGANAVGAKKSPPQMAGLET
jgi:hypothetical protein